MEALNIGYSPHVVYRKLPPQMMEALLYEADDITDVFVVDSGEGFIERYGKIESIGNVRRYVPTFMCLAASVSPQRMILNERSPAILSSLPNGERLTGKRPPLGPWSYTIRSPFGRVVAWEEWVGGGSMTLSQCNWIKESILAGKRILIVGGMGSGKSTLLSTIINDEGMQEIKIVIFESVKELIGPRISTAYLMNVLESVDDVYEIGLRESAAGFIIGEARSGREMRPVMQAASNGHLCYSTLHARNEEEALLRIQGMLRSTGDTRSAQEIIREVFTFFDAFLFMEKQDTGLRYLTGIGAPNKDTGKIEMLKV